MQQLTPTQLRTLLESTIPAGLPVLVTGSPGIGKSDIVTQAAHACNAEVILSHPAVADPTDAKGLPFPDKTGEGATFLPFGELKRAMASTEQTVWFLDDLGQAPPAVQASFMQLLLARRVNGHALPDCVTFVAATNRRTDRAGVSGILEPVKSRFACIVELTPDMHDWCQWAIGAGIPAELIAFIRFRPELLCDFKPSADLANSPLPRTWAHVAKLMALSLPGPVLAAAIAGAVGEGAAVELLAFLKLWQNLPSIDGILLDPENAPVPEKPSVLFAVSTALAAKATEKNAARVIRYAERLYEQNLGEFSALLIRDACRRVTAFAHSPAFITMASGNGLGALLAGV